MTTWILSQLLALFFPKIYWIYLSVFHSFLCRYIGNPCGGQRTTRKSWSFSFCHVIPNNQTPLDLVANTEPSGQPLDPAFERLHRVHIRLCRHIVVVKGAKGTRQFSAGENAPPPRVEGWCVTHFQTANHGEEHSDTIFVVTFLRLQCPSRLLLDALLCLMQ